MVCTCQVDIPDADAQSGTAHCMRGHSMLQVGRLLSWNRAIPKIHVAGCMVMIGFSLLRRACCCRSSRSRCQTGRRSSSRSSSASAACMRSLLQTAASLSWSRRVAAGALAKATSRSYSRALRTMSAHWISTEGGHLRGRDSHGRAVHLRVPVHQRWPRDGHMMAVQRA